MLRCQNSYSYIANKQDELIFSLIPKAKSSKKPHKVEIKRIINAIFYGLNSDTSKFTIKDSQ